MKNRFIDNCQKYQLTYMKKEGTKFSYIRTSGSQNILPKTLSIGIFTQQKPSTKQRTKKNELNGCYNKPEEGLYKELSKGKVHTSIWEYEEYSEFEGYGVIDERFNIYDLLILHSENKFTSSFTIYIFRGLGKPEYIAEVFKYLRDCVKMQKSL